MTLRNPQDESKVFTVKLGAAIKEAMDGRTNKWLADLLQVDGATVTRILKGTTPLTVDRIIKIENGLNLTHGTLIRMAEGERPSELEAIRDDLAAVQATLEKLGAAVGLLLDLQGLGDGPPLPPGR